MKKLVSIILAISVICQASAKEDYPLSQDVEPIIHIDKTGATINAAIENTIEVNLDDCIKLALGNNPQILAAMQDVFASDSRIKQLWSNYFPQFSWQSGYSRIRQLQLSDVFRENLIYNFWVLGQISGSQLLYDFGVTQNQVTISKLNNKSYQIILTETVNDVIYKVKDAYYYYIYALETKHVAADNIKRYEEFYEQAKAFYKAGVKPKVDVTIAEVNLSNAKLTYIQSEHSINIAIAKLNNAIGIPYFTKYVIKDKLQFLPCDITLEKAISISENSRPEFQLAHTKVEQAKQNYKLVKKVWLPQVLMQGQFEVGGRHPDSNYGYSFGAYINFPTVNGMLIKHQLREAGSLYEKEQANSKNTCNNLYLEVQNAYYSLDEKKNKIPVAYIGMKKAHDNYELSENRYKVGVGNPVELNDANVQNANAQLTYLRTLYEYNSARASLEKSIGRNLASTEEVILNKK